MANDGLRREDDEMARPLFLAIPLLAAAFAPLAAQDDSPDKELLERRLRACLVGGSAGAPRANLMTALLAVRSLCHTQIKRVEAVRLREVDEQFGLPEARLTARQRDDLAHQRLLATRALNHEIGMAVSNFTGLAE
jgi:hypothetical protein